ncbi:unnamed protein product, partial [Didymodactylos carnosus]
MGSRSYRSKLIDFLTDIRYLSRRSEMGPILVLIQRWEK